MDKDWICSLCKLPNSGRASQCDICDTKRHYTSVYTNPDWKCSRCTWPNSGRVSLCEMCNNKRDFPSVQVTHPDFGNVSLCGISDTKRDFTPVSSHQPFQQPLQQQYQVLDTHPVPPYDSTEELRIVLLGRTGEGKSATGNTILGEDVFTSSLSPISVTSTCQRGTCNRYGRFIQVIDTPGMFDTEMSIPEVTKEVVRCVGMTAPGPHAFILVVKPDRFTEEVQNSIDNYVKTFGEGMVKFLIIVFTRKDDLATCGKGIEYYIQKGSTQLQELVASCDNRFVAFNNRGSFDEKDEDVERLINIIDKMVKTNRGFYTNEMFRKTEELLLQKEEKEGKEQMLQMDVIQEIMQRQFDEKEANYIYLLQMQELESNRDSVRTKQDVQTLRKESVQRTELKREFIGNRKKTVNYREKTREEINKGSVFLQDVLLPGLKTVFPPLMAFLAAIL